MRRQLDGKDSSVRVASKKVLCKVCFYFSSEVIVKIRKMYVCWFSLRYIVYKKWRSGFDAEF
ncbi:hypothetical protein X777_12942 [Ooceraea biroi]|uniref:Uncharacterized protein n=1 Tax=Ooceraea biroi TaxID=2015173 RepID=A0A026VZ02_OOCBI|nr:hypothetical protein X777_12942 [Ooceraea biroi]